MSLIDNAIYVDGLRVAGPATLEDTFELMRSTGMRSRRTSPG